MLFFLLQTAPAPQMADIELRAHVTAKSVTIEKHGEANLTVRASPDAGSVVDIRAPRANGKKTMENVDITIDAKALIGGPDGG